MLNPASSFMMIVALLIPVAAQSATFNIPNEDVPGLIAAINTANTSPGADVINLFPGGTYTLTAVDNTHYYYGPTGLPRMTSQITINGNGATIQRSSAPGTPDFRILMTLRDLTLNEVTIRGGRSASGAPGYTGGGGGIRNDVGRLLLVKSTVTDNWGDNGGGIFNFVGGTLIVFNSTISYNTGYGGRTGGGILNMSNSRTTIINSTVFENRADGPPGFRGRGDAIADSFSSVGSIVIKNSIFASPTRGLGVAFIWFVPTSLGHNMCADASGQLSGPGDLNSTNPLLAPLASNGGPTQTHAPLLGSPAIDSVPLADLSDADGNPITTDQREVVRPQGAAGDIGAVEKRECDLLDDGTVCDDGDPCRDDDRCSGGACVGMPKNCDDGIACTIDTCDPVTGVCTSADVTPPEVVCPPPSALQGDANCDAPAPGASATDNCDGSLPATASPAVLTGPGFMTVSYTATDTSGNTGGCTTQFEVVCRPTLSFTSTQYCVTGTSNEASYEWWIDLRKDLVGYSTEPAATAPPVSPIGAPATAMASKFAESIATSPTSIAKHIAAIASGACFDISAPRVCSLLTAKTCVESSCFITPQACCTVAQGTCIAQPYSLHVGPSPVQPPTCVVTASGCSYNPVLTLGCTTNEQCDDARACTDDSCDPSMGCIHINNTNSCDDGNACTTGDSCGGGTCNSASSLVCNDGDACNGVETCDPTVGCAGGTPPNCDDGNACNGVETCNPSIGCVTGTPVVCPDGDQCHAAGTCDMMTGLCSNMAKPNGTPCNDGIVCTADDLCSGGVCAGAAITAPSDTQNMQVGADKVTYSWSAIAYATQYDVVRGSTGALPVGPGGGDEVCVDGLAGTTLVDPTLPSPGTGFWYLSRGANACAFGSFGSQSNGAPRSTTTAP